MAESCRGRSFFARKEDLDVFCASFLRCHVEKIALIDMHVEAYETALGKMISRAPVAGGDPELCSIIAQCIVNLFLENIGIYQRLPLLIEELDNAAQIEDSEVTGGDRRAEYCRILRSLLDINEWIPFLGAWRLHVLPAPRPCESICTMITKCNYDALHFISPCDENRREYVIELIEYMWRYPALSGTAKEIRKLIYWTDEEPVLSNMLRFAMFHIISLLDPRPRSRPKNNRSQSPSSPKTPDEVQISHARTLSAHHSQENETAPSLRDAMNARGAMNCIICQSVTQFRSAISNGALVEYLVNQARSCIGDISLSEERTLAHEITQSPLFCSTSSMCQNGLGIRQRRIDGSLRGPIDDIPKESWNIIAQLRKNICIGFDGTHRVIITGPLKWQRILSSINIARIARLLEVPRDNAPMRFATENDSPNTEDIFSVCDACIESIPEKIPRPPDIINMLRDNVDQLRAFITNCMWRFVMNFRGSSSADILVVNGAAGNDYCIFGYNECEIGATSREISSAHRKVLEVFARDIDFYKAIACKWAITLRDLATFECAICAKIPMRAQMTGIDHALLSQCAGRASIIADVWLYQLNKSG